MSKSANKLLSFFYIVAHRVICKTNFFILNPLGRVAIGLNRLVDFNLAIEVAVFSNRKRQLNVVNSDFVV